MTSFAERIDTGAWLPPELVAHAPGIDPEALGADALAEAYAAGHAAGVAEGRERALAECGPTLGAMRAVLEELELRRDLLLQDLETTIHAIALAVARKLVQRELEADPALLPALVHKALDLVPLDQPVVARVHPGDLAALEALGGGDAPRFSAVQWRADAGVARGDFVLETPQSIVDGRTDVALRDLYERMSR